MKDGYQSLIEMRGSVKTSSHALREPERSLREAIRPRQCTPSAASHRSASRAAWQPMPAAVTAWR
jgi:hypothetical protein